MKFTETSLPGCFLIDLEPHRDERGSFARTFCREEFAAHGLDGRVLQSSLSRNPTRGTLRGLHFQLPPLQEVKLVRCVQGAVFDVVVDLRPDAQTFCRWVGFELSTENGRSLYVPEGFAHGFLTLEDNTDLLYQMSQFHEQALAVGVRWNDPAIGIHWPAQPALISERDRKFADLNVDLLASRIHSALQRAAR